MDNTVTGRVEDERTAGERELITDLYSIIAQHGGSSPNVLNLILRRLDEASSRV